MTQSRGDGGLGGPVLPSGAGSSALRVRVRPLSRRSQLLPWGLESDPRGTLNRVSGSTALKCTLVARLCSWGVHIGRPRILNSALGMCGAQFGWVQSCPTLRPHEPQHARPPCPSPTPGVHPNPGVLVELNVHWVCDAIQPSHPLSPPFSSCLQSFPASGSFQMSQLFASGGQNIGVSASASVLPMNIKDWFPWGWTGWISLQSKGLSRDFSNTTIQKHQFFGAQLSL